MLELRVDCIMQDYKIIVYNRTDKIEQKWKNRIFVFFLCYITGNPVRPFLPGAPYNNIEVIWRIKLHEGWKKVYQSNKCEISHTEGKMSWPS